MQVKEIQGKMKEIQRKIDFITSIIYDCKCTERCNLYSELGHYHRSLNAAKRAAKLAKVGA